MLYNCPICNNALKKIQHEGGKQYFLCTVDPTITPANIDITSGIGVDAYGCINCGTVILNSPKIKEQ